MKIPGRGDSCGVDRTANAETMKRVLHRLSVDERKIVKSYYLLGRLKEHICREFGVTAHELRRIIARAWALFKELRGQGPDVE